MADQDEGFLSRWSRLKRVKCEPSSVVQAEEPAGEEASPVATVAAPDTGLPAEVDDSTADLPAIDSLDKDSDYTAFLRAGVAPELRKRALGKLWRSDPVFANLDGLLEYGEDFSAQFKNPTAVATLYQVGKGMMQTVLSEPASADASPPDEAVTEPPAAENTERPQLVAAVAKSKPSETADVAEAHRDEQS